MTKEEFKCLENKFYKMRQRCYDPRAHNYHRYGGRGIAICKSWLNNKYIFYKWAMKNGFKVVLTIDRTNNDKGYSPGNCRFVDMYVQAKNKSRVLNHKGLYSSDIAKGLGLDRSAIMWRKRNGKNIFTPRQVGTITPVRDEEGNVFVSLKKCADYHGLYYPSFKVMVRIAGHYKSKKYYLLNKKEKSELFKKLSKESEKAMLASGGL